MPLNACTPRTVAGPWLALATTSCAPAPLSPPAAPPPLQHRAYVWQRTWTAPVADAVAQASSALEQVVVLGVEHEAAATHWTGLWEAPPTAPVGVALRWSDTARALDPVQAVADARAVWDRAAHAGLHMTELHLDADIPTARLRAWAAVVDAVAAASPGPVVVLVLPDHIGKPGWHGLDAAAARLVVQVHSVPLPIGGSGGVSPGAQPSVLLDTARATTWLEQARAATQGELSVALPTHTLFARQTGAAVRADPATVADWLRLLPPMGIRAVDWFRLPVPGDRTTWTTATFARVRAGEHPAVGCAVELAPPPAPWGAGADAQVVQIRATGEDHVWLPSFALCGDEAFAAVPLGEGILGGALSEDPAGGHCIDFSPATPQLISPAAPETLVLTSSRSPLRLTAPPPCGSAPAPPEGSR